MPEIPVSEEICDRVTAFKQVVEAVIEEEMSLDDCVELILAQGIDAMLTDLLGPQDSRTLLMSLQQLGWRHPAEVYEYVAKMLRTGAATQEQEKMRQQLGFRVKQQANQATWRCRIDT